MISIKEILQQICVIYDGVELNSIKAIKDYGEFLCDVIDSQERHTAAITLHTGSEYYQAMAIAVSVLGCIFHRNSDTNELMESLSVNDMLIMDGQRVRYKGILDGSSFGMKSGTKYYEFEVNGGSKYIPYDRLNNYEIAPYHGNSVTLGGQGIKGVAPLKARKDFLTALIKDKVKKDISTEISNSIVVIFDRNTAEQFYKGIFFNYNNKKYALSEIVTATYFSEEESYQIGNNPTKEEPIIKFYSKVSVCRDAILNDKEKRIVGCFVGDENVWADNSEIHDIVDRKGIKFVLLSGKTHYIRYIDWYEADEYKFNALVPETVRRYDEDEYRLNTQIFKREISSFARRNVIDVSLSYGIESNVVFEVKRKLLKIKKECFESEAKDDFLMTCYFLLNLCRSSFFPLCYCEIAYQKRYISWTVDEKLAIVRRYIGTLIGELKDDVQYIYENISQMVLSIYYSNPKAEYLKSKLVSKKYDYIVVPKAYYEHIFLLWVNDCKITKVPQIITGTAFEKSRSIFTNVIFSTVYFDFSLNPYASFNFVSAEVLQYEYENLQASYLKKIAEKGRKLLNEKNTVRYDIVVEPEESIASQFTEDEVFESEMDKMAKDLLLTSAYRNLSTSTYTGDGTVKIEKIFTFASGCIGYFTKYYKGYRVRGEEVAEVDLDDLKVGDSMVFTKQSENKDIVDLLLNQLLKDQYKNTAYPEYYRLSICWKEALRDYMSVNRLTYQQVAERLGKVGCKRHYATIRSWIDVESHIVGPRDLEDYEAMLRLVDLGEFPVDIKNGCDHIRSLRMRILDLLGKAIIRGMFKEDKDPVSELVYAEAENLTQIEQITSINDLGANAGVPIYMINKPCNT